MLVRAQRGVSLLGERYGIVREGDGDEDAIEDEQETNI